MKINYHSYYKSIPEEYGEGPGIIDIYADTFIMTRPKKNSVAILVEPRSIIPDAYNWIEQHYERYAYVYTFDSRLIDQLPNAKLFLYGHIKAEYPQGPKDKNISMVCSNKTICQGHKDRQRIARQIKDSIDVYGTFDGGPYADYKDIYLGYRFHVAMENLKDGYYFTEKICNCFASKIIPIYYGTSRITKFFDADGILLAVTPDDIPRLVETVLKDPIGEYNNRLNAVERNYKYVQDYRQWGINFLKANGDDLERLAKERQCNT